MRNHLFLLFFFLFAVEASAQHISEFTSVTPQAQDDHFHFPHTHNVQVLFQTGDSIEGIGLFRDAPDFTPYVGFEGRSDSGWLCVNHELEEGSVDVFNVRFNPEDQLWEHTNATSVDFSDVIRTKKNCSGGITPWGTVISAEEFPDNLDLDSNSVMDVGWLVEFDPATAQLIDHDGDQQGDKLWAMGRMSHENVVVLNDSITAFYGSDDSFGFVYKFVADQPGDLSQGTIYTLILDTATQGTTGDWVQVPNATVHDRNRTTFLADSLGATSFRGVEDVEVNPLNGMLYFSAKFDGHVYRFNDAGSGVTDFELYIDNESFPIEHLYGTTNEWWGIGADNLCFDNLGNLWLCQDGSRNHIWVIHPNHSSGNPMIRIFGVTPYGCEPTGLNFTPDFKYMFLSIMHPNWNNDEYMIDASGQRIKWNRPSTMVFALKENLGTEAVPEPQAPLEIMGMFPVPTADNLYIELQSPHHATARWHVFDVSGKEVLKGNYIIPKGASDLTIETQFLPTGTYTFRIDVYGESVSRSFIR